MKRLLLLAGAASILFIIGGGTAHAGTDHSKPPASIYTPSRPSGGSPHSAPASTSTHATYPTKTSSKPCPPTATSSKPAPHTSTVSVPPAPTSTTAAPTPTGVTTATTRGAVVPAVSVQPTSDIGTAVSTELARTGPGWLPTAVKFGLMFVGAGIVLLGTAWFGERS